MISMSTQATVISLPALVVLVPLIGAFIAYIIGKGWREKYGHYTAALISILTFLITVLMYPYVSGGGEIEYTLASLTTMYPITFYVDSFSFIFALATSFIWMVATIYSITYVKKEHATNRYFLFLIMTLAVNMGVIVGGDLFVIYIFFELLALFSLMLVIHEQSLESYQAGKVYFYVGAFCGLMLLIGIILLFMNTGSMSINPRLGEISELGNLKYLIVGLMILGFGGKAGIFPVHIWLPKAHPVAPTPASALLSAIMVKAGIYGIFRTTGTIFTPSDLATTWALPEIGYWVIWIAIITSFIGWIFALFQDNIKTLLAYSTISQIGLLMIGIGAAAYLGYEGAAMGYAGSLYHVANHALYKSALFFIAGIIYFRTGTLKMSEMGQLYKKMPITFILCIIALLGIAGMPLFNGYVSKTIIHHALYDAYALTGDQSLYIAEILFKIIGGGTVAYSLKLLISTFLTGDSNKKIKKAPKLMAASVGTIATLIILIGLFPSTLLQNLITPVLETHSLNPESITYVSEINVFITEDLTAVLTSFAIGIALYSGAYILKLETRSWPKLFTVNNIYNSIIKGITKTSNIVNLTGTTVNGYFSTKIFEPILKSINAQKEEQQNYDIDSGRGVSFAIFLIVLMLAIYMIYSILMF
ncbi:proton-conducting transporter membrane subunit [Methanonatronarchaeum sp. AMET-Sl]|uniref:complex I subunit 5 family protein n=1 Tax=Methanonatronarchaeum sp. AMET-Sl TaxID=3037654 RepID=UPI00244DA4DB|nr:proton-conducting transporter membrane subunit [Methanonatronarchaeum sp. AMET-Sl]WGI17462.1 proton-conducting transporter membrane subunit [Methanonatronarchaeum sp. AMET-Sl]